MGCIACPHTSCSIAVGIVGAFADFNVRHAVVDGGSVAGREPVLHVCVPVPQPVAWQARHGVIQMRDPVFVARLLRDETRKLLVADAGRSVGEDIAGEPVLAEPCTGHGGHCCTQTVPGGDDAEVWVAFAGGFNQTRHGRVHIIE